jgi:glycosyltransferase involved in cell wall biosynthesis
MKVLNILVGGATRVGGPPAFVGESARELSKLGVTVRILTTDLTLAPWGWLQRQKRVRPDELHPSLAGADLGIFPARFPRRLAFSPQLSSAVRAEAAAFDVIHIHNLWQFPQYATYRTAMRRGVPYVVSPHGGLDPYLRQRGRVRKRLTTALWQEEMLSGAALIHVTTEAERELIADTAPHVPRALVPCGLHVSEFSRLPSPEQFRRERLNGYDGPVILFLGRVTEKKGVDVLIRAFAAVRRTHACRLVVAGPDDSSTIPILRRLATELEVSSDTVFLGPVYGDERLAALACADIWALSSHTENFGIAVVEAMAAGRAVVISTGVNLAADVAASGAGIVAPARPTEFADALRRVLVDDQLRRRLESAGPAFAARYDWRVVTPQMLQMYRTATSGRVAR